MNLKERAIAIVGESQFGKSSFINMISGLSQRVGSGDGRSCTSEYIPISFGDRLHLFGNSEVMINCDDIPGFEDTGMLVSNSQILDSLKMRLAGLERREFDAILVFQSIVESKIELARTLMRIERIFGSLFTQSTIVIVTKSDMLAPKEIKKKMITIESILSPKCIPFMMWVNNADGELVEEEAKQAQINALRTALTQIKPFKMMEMEEFNRIVEERANRLKAQDTVKQSVAIPTQRVETYTNTLTTQVPTSMPKYTEEEVKKKAREIENSSENKHEITETVVESMEMKRIRPTTTTFLWGLFSHEGSMTVTETQLVPTSKTQTIKLRSGDEIAKGLREERKIEMVEEKRDVKEFKVKDEIVNVSMDIAKHDDSYYKAQASKDLARERWKGTAN